MQKGVLPFSLKKLVDNVVREGAGVRVGDGDDGYF